MLRTIELPSEPRDRTWCEAWQMHALACPAIRNQPKDLPRVAFVRSGLSVSLINPIRPYLRPCLRAYTPCAVVIGQLDYLVYSTAAARGVVPWDFMPTAAEVQQDKRVGRVVSCGLLRGPGGSWSTGLVSGVLRRWNSTTTNSSATNATGRG
jgi:hypothetical protein